ncbi:SMEK domain-containing protein [Listeria booriae]|uniref:ABC-three component system protein n=1 Tax=Listeria booriae TaxID=1552123 RepID=UPI0016284CB5|nr:ABC-three component system protein [Listeria booriae]MBC2056235.1 SMEK domain-containing protein [Listeria booriae]
MIYYQYISSKIEILSQQIVSNGKLNLLDMNVHSEIFFRDFFNCLYGYSLVTANSEVANMEAIDLIDETSKILIQVTSNRSRGKINSTLEKDTIKEYAGKSYRLKFIFITGDAKNLRAQKFENVHNITFVPKADIMDKISVLRDVYSCGIEKLVLLYDFVRKELGEQSSSEKRSSNLATIINLLAESDLNNSEVEMKLDEYNIDNKITFNDLGAIKNSTIDDKKQYCGILDRIYKEFDKQGKNKTLSVFSKLAGFYEKELLDLKSSNVDKFFNIILKTTAFIKESDNFNNIPEEELEFCVRIIVVDAFIRCKIFENPGGYEYVTT